MIAQRSALPPSLPDVRAEWLAKQYFQPIPEETEEQIQEGE